MEEGWEEYCSWSRKRQGKSTEYDQGNSTPHERAIILLGASPLRCLLPTFATIPLPHTTHQLGLGQVQYKFWKAFAAVE